MNAITTKTSAKPETSATLRVGGRLPADAPGVRISARLRIRELNGMVSRRSRKRSGTCWRNGVCAAPHVGLHQTYQSIGCAAMTRKSYLA